jgi:hypothetical protein
MKRQGTGFWVHYNAYNSTTNKGVTGDVLNHHLKFVIDGVETEPINTPEAVRFDEYRIFVTPEESLDAKFIRVGGISDTPDVYIISTDIITNLLKPGEPFVGCYTTWDEVNNIPMLGDAGNHSMFIAQDDTDSAAPGQSEVNAITLPGTYKVSATGVQSNGREVSIIGSSSNPNAGIISTELSPYNEDQANEDDVREDINYSENTLKGNLNLPVEPDVRSGVKYGTNSIELTGSLSISSVTTGFDEDITIEREDSPGNWADGNYVKGATTITNTKASVQPLNGRDLLLLPESDRVNETIKIFLTTEVKERDIITVLNTGKKYMVRNIRDWSSFSFNHFRALCVITEGK